MTRPPIHEGDGVATATEQQFEHVRFAQDHPATLIDWTHTPAGTPIRLAVIDERPSTQPHGTFLLLHGEPTWSALYQDWIAPLLDAGYRVVAVDQPGFGRSDKPTDDAWYSYERHCAAVRHVIDTLDLSDIHLVVQDWAGPIGLRNATDQPHRFTQINICNTWLHEPDHPYTGFIRWWQTAAADPAELGGDMPTGTIVANTLTRPGHDLADVAAVFDAPFTNSASKAGARAFPATIPITPDRHRRGGATAQADTAAALRAATGIQVHFVWGDADAVFPLHHGQRWADTIPNSTFTTIEDAGHFVQLDAPEDCLAAITSKRNR
jgi:haloalkane dehalogenase